MFMNLQLSLWWHKDSQEQGMVWFLCLAKGNSSNWLSTRLLLNSEPLRAGIASTRNPLNGSGFLILDRCLNLTQRLHLPQQLPAWPARSTAQHNRPTPLLLTGLHSRTESFSLHSLQLKPENQLHWTASSSTRLTKLGKADVRSKQSLLQWTLWISNHFCEQVEQK